MLTKSWEWFRERAAGTGAKAWLLVFSFTESCCFIIPPDPLMAAILLVRGDRWLYYALITSAASVLGALFGYLFAAFFFDTVGAPIISFYGLEEELAMVRDSYESDAFLVTLLAAFTPIPFKVFVLGAGFLKVNFALFIFASIVGRTLRYVLIAYATHRWGARVIQLVTRYSGVAAVVLTVLVALYLMRHFL